MYATLTNLQGHSILVRKDAVVLVTPAAGMGYAAGAESIVVLNTGDKFAVTQTVAQVGAMP